MKLMSGEKSGGERPAYMDLLKVIGLSCILLEIAASSGRVSELFCFDVPLIVMLYACRESSETDSFCTPGGFRRFLGDKFKRLFLTTWAFLIFYFIFLYFIDGNLFDSVFYRDSFLMTRYGPEYIWVVPVLLYVAVLVPCFSRMKGRASVFAVAAVYVLYEVIRYLGVLQAGASGAGAYNSGVTATTAYNTGFAYILLELTVCTFIPYGMVAFIGSRYEKMGGRTRLVLTASAGLLFVGMELICHQMTGSFARPEMYRFPAGLFYIAYGVFVSLVMFAVSRFVTERKGFMGIISDNPLLRFISDNSLNVFFCFLVVLKLYEHVNISLNRYLGFVICYCFSVAAVFAYGKAVAGIKRTAGNRNKVIPAAVMFITAIVPVVLGMVLSGNGAMREVPADQPVVESRPDLSNFVSDDAENADLEMQRLESVINLNLKYLLDTWWNSPKYEALTGYSNMTAAGVLSGEDMSLVRRSRKSFENWRQEEYLYLPVHKLSTAAENSIRPLSHVCAVAAAALAGGFYDEEVVGISGEDAKSMLIRLITSAAEAYMENRWGRTWQSSLWAENIGFAAWLVWDDIPEKDRKNLAYMILSEADYVLQQELLYYRDAEGTVLSDGDSKGEEIAWNSKILALALCMFPDHEDSELWENKLEQMLQAATSAPGEPGGSNINSDGTVINHNRCHIDYMTTIIGEMTETEILFGLAGREVSESAYHNVDMIFNALVNVDLGTYDDGKAGEHFYQRDADGNVTAGTDMPGENDWGGHWYGSFYLTDVYVDLFGLDAGTDDRYKAAEWEKVHLEELERMVGECGTGGLFKDGENFFVSGEMFQMHNLVKACMLKMLFTQ